MADNNNQAQNNPVEVTQDAAMPTVEQKVPMPSQTDNGGAQQEVTPQLAQGSGLPNEVSERTKREFDKLQEQLRAEREERIRLQGVWNTVAPQTPQQTKPLYDPTTGLLDESVFTDVQRRASEAEARAKQAEARVQQYEQNQIRSKDELELQEAVVAHPELDSTGKQFDKRLHNQVRAILQDSLLHPEDYGPKTLTYKQAADLAKGIDQKKLDEARQDGTNQALEQLSPKEQASLEATGSPARRAEVNSPLPDLRARTRKGDIDSIVQRMRGLSK